MEFFSMFTSVLFVEGALRWQPFFNILLLLLSWYQRNNLACRILSDSVQEFYSRICWRIIACSECVEGWRHKTAMASYAKIKER